MIPSLKLTASLHLKIGRAQKETRKYSEPTIFRCKLLVSGRVFPHLLDHFGSSNIWILCSDFFWLLGTNGTSRMRCLKFAFACYRKQAKIRTRGPSKLGIALEIERRRTQHDPYFCCQPVFHRPECSSGRLLHICFFFSPLDIFLFRWLSKKSKRNKSNQNCCTFSCLSTI